MFYCSFLFSDTPCTLARCIYSYVHIHHIWFLRSSFDGTWSASALEILWLVFLRTFICKVLCRHNFCYSDICLGTELLIHMLISYLAFSETIGMLLAVVKLHFCYFPPFFFFWLLRFPLFLSVSVLILGSKQHTAGLRGKSGFFFMGKGASFKLGQNLRVQS